MTLTMIPDIIKMIANTAKPYLFCGRIGIIMADTPLLLGLPGLPLAELMH